MRNAILIGIGLVVAAIGSAEAQDILPVRAMGMGTAHRAVVTSNDAIVLNPAGMALFSHYALESHYRLTPHKGAADGPVEHALQVSVVDNSQGLAFATGLAFTQIWGGDRKEGNRWDLAFGFPASEHLFLGVNTKYLHFKETKTIHVDAVSTDVGVLAVLGSGFTVGVVGYNLTNPAEYIEHPVSMAAALLYSPIRTLELTFDWVVNFQKPDDPSAPLGPKGSAYAYNVGMEYLLVNEFTLRAGYSYDQTLPGAEGHYLSGGLGYVSPQFAMDFGYRGSLDHTWDGAFGVSMRFFM